MERTSKAVSAGPSAPRADAEPPQEDAHGHERSRRARLRAALRSSAFARSATPVVALALVAGILAFDLRSPSGVAVSVLYAIPVLVTVFARDARLTLAFTVLASAMLVEGWTRMDASAGESSVLANRWIAVGLIWLCGSVVVSRLVTGSRFRTALEAAPAGMLVLNRRGNIVFANGEAERIFGAKPDRLLGERPGRFLAVHVGREHISFDEALARTDAKRSPGRGDAEGTRLDGTSFPADAEWRVVEREVGSCILLTVRDLTEEVRREHANERLAAIVRCSQDAMLTKDLDGYIRDWNPGAEEIYGYTAEEVQGKHISIIVPEARRAEVDTVLAAVAAGDDVALQTRRTRKDGRTIDVDLSISPLYDRHGRVRGASVCARDRTAEREVERRMHEQHEALSYVMPGRIEVGPAHRIATANAAAHALVGASEGQLCGTSWLDLVNGADHPEAERAFEEMVSSGSGSFTASAPDGSDRSIELFLVRRLDTEASAVRFHVFLRDVTARTQAETRIRELVDALAEKNRQLEHQVNVDPLTGILNRRGLERRIRRLRSGARRVPDPSSVLLVDLDDFKSINDGHGHAVGDRVLLAVAEALESGARVSDPVARIGGDEFLVVLPETAPSEAHRIAERIREQVRSARVPAAEGDVRVTCSIGVAALSLADMTIEAAVVAARAPLSASKHGGKDRVCANEADTADEHGPSASGDERLRVLHQPIYDLLEDRIAAFELFAFATEGRDTSRPSDMTQLESCEARTRWDLACLRACVEASDALPDLACLHVNLLPGTLVELGAVSILEALRRAGVERSVCVELDGGAVPGDPAALGNEVRALRAAGVQVAVDHVGRGGTSLDTLLHLEPDVIKISPHLLDSSDGASVLERLLSVAGVLRARVVVAGLERERTLQALLRRHVRFGQGPLWGPPAPLPSEPEGVLWPRPRRAGDANARPRAADVRSASA